MQNSSVVAMQLQLVRWSWFSILVLQASYCMAQAQTVQEAIWNIPDSSLSDLSQTFTSGTTLPLSWNPYKSSAYIDASNSLLDLWVSTYDFAQNPYSQLLKENINLTVPGGFAWTIDIADEDLSASAEYVLRFKEPALRYEQNTPDLSSPGFLVLRANSPSSLATPSLTASSAAASSSATSSSTRITPTSSMVSLSVLPSSTVVPSSVIPAASTIGASSPSGAVSTNDACTSCGLSTGAKAGIGIGIAALVLTVAGAAYFCFTRKRKTNTVSPEPLRYQMEIHEYPHQDKSAPPSYAVELPARGNWTHAELPER
ncbi:hypothetical protein PVAG01_08099 [Phlyctema vagabunda]|uniref:Mid2 domain-containing protein n=1 Tax=Phlyctema vagabunda TaxID=108571 RepID=A0ABR4P936_9HELO